MCKSIPSPTLTTDLARLLREIQDALQRDGWTLRSTFLHRTSWKFTERFLMSHKIRSREPEKCSEMRNPPTESTDLAAVRRGGWRASRCAFLAARRKGERWN